MSIDLPQGLQISHFKELDAFILQQMDKYLDKTPRSEGLHASDLLDPRYMYWSKKKPLLRTAQQTYLYTTGKTLEDFFIHITSQKKSPAKHLGGQQQTSEEFGLEFAPDWEYKGIPLELKSSRSPFLPKEFGDIRIYLEQCAIYMTVMKRLDYALTVWYLCARDEKNKTHPMTRSYHIQWTEADLEYMVKQVKAKIYHVKEVMKRDDPSLFPVCREWKCGERQCFYWEDCQPPGRYGLKYSDWEKTEDPQLILPEGMTWDTLSFP